MKEDKRKKKGVRGRGKMKEREEWGISDFLKNLGNKDINVIKLPDKLQSIPKKILTPRTLNILKMSRNLIQLFL